MAENVEALYNQLTPEQRTAIAQQYLQQFHESGNPASHQKFADVDPNTATPQQLAAMHKHAETTHPGMLQQIRKHPLVTAALAGIAAFELDKHFGK